MCRLDDQKGNLALATSNIVNVVAENKSNMLYKSFCK